MAVVAGTVDSGRRRVWQLRASQPSGVLAIAMWGLGLVGMAGFGLLSGDVFFHDTFAELAPGHLLGPMLAGVVLAAGAVDRLRGWSVLPWLGLACCALVTGGGVCRIAAGFLTLGLEGLPRRYYSYAPDGGTGWLESRIRTGPVRRRVVGRYRRVCGVGRCLAVRRARTRPRVNTTQAPLGPDV